MCLRFAQPELTARIAGIVKLSMTLVNTRMTEHATFPCFAQPELTARIAGIVSTTLVNTRMTEHATFPCFAESARTAQIAVTVLMSRTIQLHNLPRAIQLHNQPTVILRPFQQHNLYVTAGILLL